MAFESLTEKLQNVFKNLKGKGRLSEDDVRAALKDVKMALLEADVNFKVVKQFINAVTERAVGQDVLEGINPGQMVIKIVNEEMTSLMGSEVTELTFKPGKEVTVFMLCGLQGAGKTTAAAKIAGRLKLKSKKTLLAACDIYRPAAIDQLKRNGEKIGCEVFEMGTDTKPSVIAKNAYDYAVKNGFNVVILDTAGRLHNKKNLMEELRKINRVIDRELPDYARETMIVLDGTTGQNALEQAREFRDVCDISGIILTKLDGSAKGGIAVAIQAEMKIPVKYIGVGEKLDDLRKFNSAEFVDALFTRPADTEDSTED